MDFGFWEDKLTATIDWYTETTRDMLMNNVRIPSNTGYYTLAYKNVGSMRNTGWELNLNTNKLMKFSKKFWMDVNVTLGNNKNEILTMDPQILETLNSTFAYGNREVLQRVQVHNPI